MQYKEILENTVKKAASFGVSTLTPAAVETVNGHKCEVVFGYAIRANKTLSRPAVKIVTDYDSGTILLYQNAFFREFADAAKYPVDASLRAGVPTAKTAKEQLQLVREMTDLYECVRTFALEDNLTVDQKSICKSYRDCLAATVPTDLLAFCKDTEPAFYSWLENAAD